MYGLYGIALLLGGIGISVLVWLASKNGRNAQRLEMLKAELKKQAEEQKRAQQITHHVYALSVDDARRRLHDLANKQR